LQQTLERLGLGHTDSVLAHTIVKQRLQGETGYPVFLVWGKRPE
jgi:hypothetical protein